MIPPSRDAQRAALRRQLIALLRDLETGSLDGATVVVARGETRRSLDRVRAERDERVLRSMLRLLVAIGAAERLEQIAESAHDLCVALGLRHPRDAEELLRAWSYERGGRR